MTVAVRVLLLCPTWGQLGGIERKAESLVGVLRRQGHAVAILARGARAASTPEGDVPVFRIPYHVLPGRPYRLVRSARFLARLPGLVAGSRRAARRWRADVALSLAVSAYAPYAIGLSTAVPLVFSVESGGPDFAKHQRALGLAFRRSARVVVCARSLATDARALAPAAAARVVVIPNGVDLEQFNADGPRPDRPRPYVLAAGRLTRQKGFDILIEAFARLGSEAAGIDLLLAGDGIEHEPLSGLARQRGVADRVRFLGPADSATLATLYRGALVVACPSRYEGLPLVCLEAMACGAPLVGSAVDGIPDAIVAGENGLLVPPEDPAALARALADLLGDPARRARFAARGRALAQRFGWPAVGACYSAVLTETAVRSGA